MISLKSKIILNFLFLLSTASAKASVADSVFISQHQKNEEALIHEVYYPILFADYLKGASFQQGMEFTDGDQLPGFAVSLEKKLAYIGLRLSTEHFSADKNSTLVGEENIEFYNREYSRTGILLPIYFYSTQKTHFAVGGGYYSGQYNVSMDDLYQYQKEDLYVKKKTLATQEVFVEFRYRNFICNLSATRIETQEVLATLGLGFVGIF